jgi:signal transduction histidine kinase
LPILFVIIIFASIFLVKRTLSPINEIIHTAGKISAQNLNERIKYEADSSDEIGRLRDTLNNLFERLEFQVHQISQFTDHASHQLMNPLTIIKSELDFALRKERNSEDYKNSLVLLSEQTEKMIKIINQLLIISKHENEPSSRKSLFNLSKLIIEDISKVFKNVNLSYQIEPDIYLRGSSEIFSIVIENLIDNALKYSISDPEVKITVKKTKDKIEVIVSDNGIGIENQDKDKVFERFFRTGKAEEIGIKGFGLGLTVVKSILTQMNGSISVEDNIPQGSKFIVRLPTVNIE